MIIGLNRIGEDEEYETMSPRGGLTASKLATHNRSFHGGSSGGHGGDNTGMLTGRRSNAGRSDVGSTMSNKSGIESLISMA
jgi:hypothetical protein